MPDIFLTIIMYFGDYKEFIFVSESFGKQKQNT